MTSDRSIDDVKRYWEAHPLGTLEVQFERGSEEYFEAFNVIREADEGLFARPIYEFDKHRGERVLDIGCGNGWPVSNFAKGGARATGIDLTESAIALTRKRLELMGLEADLVVGNAERMPFADGTFDYVSSSGVLHHTPDTHAAMAEAVRVIKVGGGGMISLYYRHALLRPALWPLTRFFVRLLFAMTPGRDGFGRVRTPDDLIRMYDGNENPVGRAYTLDDMKRMLPGCRVEHVEYHFFPTRFLTRRCPMWVRRVLDRWLGLMIYVRFTKTETIS